MKYIGKLVMTSAEHYWKDIAQRAGEDNSPCRFVKLYKVFPMIYAFNQSGLICFVRAKEFDDKHGKYEANKRGEIRKCGALYFEEHQREPAREIRFFADERWPDLSISGNTLLRIMSHHMSTTGLSFQTSDLRLFFDEFTNSLNDAERVFENYVQQLATRFPEKRR